MIHEPSPPIFVFFVWVHAAATMAPWSDVLRVDGELAQYLRLKESMVVKGNEAYLCDEILTRVQSDTDLSLFPDADKWPSPLWSFCLSALRLELHENHRSSSRDAQSWRLQQGICAEQGKMVHRRHSAESRQRVSAGLCGCVCGAIAVRSCCSHAAVLPWCCAAVLLCCL